MLKISVMLPCYNEEENVVQIYEAVRSVIVDNLPNYNYEILFVDNKSTDNTRELIRKICFKDKNVKAIFNIANFGQFNSPYHALCQCSGDCVISMSSDFQDPPKYIVDMVHEWEKGNSVVCMVKTSSKENPIIYKLRGIYYNLIHKMSNIDQIKQFAGFCLFDKTFIKLLRELNDPTPFIKGIISEYAPNRVEIPYEQQKRKAGKSKNNFFTLYDAAMLSFTSYTKGGLRIATFIGLIISSLSFLLALVYLIMKLIMWNEFIAGNAPILIGVYFLGGIQLFFLGLLGEYVMTMNSRVINKPLVVEEERINMDLDNK
ncbi:MAG: glycosyltransferase family 2 protein [Eubacterium sp.]|nr:glycosyltransferase family 2 protein [Eubacterium sp.]